MTENRKEQGRNENDIPPIGRGRSWLHSDLGMILAWSGPGLLLALLWVLL